jgi:hypothetical protein
MPLISAAQMGILGKRGQIAIELHVEYSPDTGIFTFIVGHCHDLIFPAKSSDVGFLM